MDSNRKGAVAEQAVLLAAMRLGIPVLKPVAEHCRYDLAFDLGSRILRVQVKWAALKGDVIYVHVGRCRTKKRGYVRATYLESEIDALAAYCEELDRCYLLPVGMIAGKHAIHLRTAPTKNRQAAAINWSHSYELGAVAQLEEHQSGTLGAEGSSPSSSTEVLEGGESRPSFEMVFPDPLDDLSVGGEVPMDQFYARLAHYVRHAEAGNETLVTRWGKPVARLIPAQPSLLGQS